MTTIAATDTTVIDFAYDWADETFAIDPADMDEAALYELVAGNYEGGWFQMVEDAHSVVYISR